MDILLSVILRDQISYSYCNSLFWGFIFQFIVSRSFLRVRTSKNAIWQTLCIYSDLLHFAMFLFPVFGNDWRTKIFFKYLNYYPELRYYLIIFSEGLLYIYAKKCLKSFWASKYPNLRKLIEVLVFPMPNKLTQSMRIENKEVILLRRSSIIAVCKNILHILKMFLIFNHFKA